MYDLTHVINGLTKFIDNEILVKITGWQKWVIGAGAGMALSKSTNLFNEIKNNPMVKSLGVINNDDLIDVDTLYKELRKQAQKGAITFDVPMMGALTLNEHDVEKLYMYIKEQS